MSQWAGWRLKSPASRLFTQPFRQAQVKETSKPRVTGPCAVNSPGTVKFPAHMVSNAETASIWWRHHDSIALNWYLPFQVDPYISLHWSQISIMAHQLTGKSVVCSKVCVWPPTQKTSKFRVNCPVVKRIHWWPVDSRHEGLVMGKASVYRNVINCYCYTSRLFLPTRTMRDTTGANDLRLKRLITSGRWLALAPAKPILYKSN